MTVSLLSWYHWSDSVWLENSRQQIRIRAEESRQKRAERLSTGSPTNEETNKSFEEDEDISIIDEKSLRRDEDDSDDIEELSSFSGSALRLRKQTAAASEEPTSTTQKATE